MGLLLDDSGRSSDLECLSYTFPGLANYYIFPTWTQTQPPSSEGPGSWCSPVTSLSKWTLPRKPLLISTHWGPLLELVLFETWRPEGKPSFSRSTTPGSGLLLSTGVRYFRPATCPACGLTADRPWACAEPLHQDKWDVGRTGNRQGHRRDWGGLALRSSGAGSALKGCPGPRASVPGGRPGKKASSRLPPRPHPAATPASFLSAPDRRPSDTRAGRGGAAKVPRRPQRPAPPRLPCRAFLTSPSSPPPPPPLPVGRPEVTQRAGANGAAHVIAGERSAARSEAREVVPETRVGVGGKGGVARHL